MASSPFNYRYPFNIYNTLTSDVVTNFSHLFDEMPRNKENNKRDFDSIAGLCKSRSRRNSYTPPQTPPLYINVYGVPGNYTDSDGADKPGLKFICKASSRNILYLDKEQPVYGRIFYGRFDKIKYTIKNDNDYIMIPTNIVVQVGGIEHRTPEDSPYLLGVTNFSTEFWIYVDEELGQLKDNSGEFEFILFWYSEEEDVPLVRKLKDYEEKGFF